ncbi:MAG TPA: DUF47 domain-containing protein [Myxococcota bacterium]|nr:DUF47 family protein [Myxococcales bacterium]HPG28010.1 DUF47 domain-containing protein [Myxococcota bacterium]
MDDDQPGFWRGLLARFVPEVPDFAALLERQSRHVRATVDDLVEYVESADPGLQERLRHDETEAQRLRDANMTRLNNAFSTPFDREDIYRAIEELDWIVVHVLRTANEMDLLQVPSDEFIRRICLEIQTGVVELATGFGRLGSDVDAAYRHAESARRIDRRARDLYEHALAELFRGEVVVDMLKRREIYHHLADGAKRVRKTAEVLQDLVVKNA